MTSREDHLLGRLEEGSRPHFYPNPRFVIVHPWRLEKRGHWWAAGTGSGRGDTGVITPMALARGLLAG